MQGLTGSYDVGFELTFEPAAPQSSSRGATASVLVPLKRMAAHLQLIRGEYTPPIRAAASAVRTLPAGRYTLRWDNTYSRLRQKKLHYRI